MHLALLKSSWRGATALLLLLPLFIAYPLALVMPVNIGVPLVFQLELPVLLAMALFCLLYLLATPLAAVNSRWTRSAELIQLTLLLVVIACVASAVVGRSVYLEKVFVASGYFAIPLFFATCQRRWLSRSLTGVLAVLWLVQVAHGLWQLGTGFQVVGLAGNRNWMSTLLVALLPWPLLWLLQLRRCTTPTNSKVRQLLTNRWTQRLLAVAIASVSLILAGYGMSRGTWLALAAYAIFFWLLPRLSVAARVTVGAIAILLVSGVIWLWPQRVVATIEADIRLPLYAQTVRMIADHPFLGVGPGNYRRDFARYRSAAHKGRAVAAPVTEHPHNELLNVAASLGVPLALVWCLVLLPLLLPPPRPTPFWQAVHFCAWIIVAHAMLDKLLIQPPTSLLALICIGLLWRPRLPVRAGRTGRPRLLAIVLPAAAVLVTAFAVQAGWRQWRNQWYFRKAVIAEAHGQLATAYTAYARSARVEPRDTRAHALAGIFAINKLHEPLLALEHLKQALRLEPDYAHINGHIGLALGTLGLQREALPYLERELELYPFDETASQRLLFCLIALGDDLKRVLETHEQLAQLRWRRVNQRLGNEPVLALAKQWYTALMQEDMPTAVAAANQLLAPLSTGIAETVYFELAEQAQLPPDLQIGSCTSFDAFWWHQNWAWLQAFRKAAAHHAGVEALLQYFWTQVVPVAAPVPKTLLGDGNEFALLQFARAAGWQAALGVDAANVSTGIVAIKAEGRDWLANPATATFIADATFARLTTDDALAERLGLLPTTNRTNWQLQFVAHPLDFCSRTLALRQIIFRALPAMPLPAIGLSPHLQRLPWTLSPKHTLPFNLTPFRKTARILADSSRPQP